MTRYNNSRGADIPVCLRSKADRNVRLTRPGLTLLEVVIALAIFLIALVPIWHLVTLGGEQALDVAHQAQASMLCQAKLDCVKVGAEPLNTSGTVDIGRDLTWNYTIESSPGEVENLYMVKVTVNGRMEVVQVRLSDEAARLNDREMLEDLIRAAMNQAMQKARMQVAEETSKMATGMGLPAGMTLPGMG